MVEIQPPTTFKYNLNYPCPVFFVPNLPGEEFVMIPEHAADVLPYYAISNFGRIWHVYENKFMSFGSDGGGYSVAVLVNKMGFPQNFRVHRLVMLTFRYDEYLEMVAKYPDSRIVVSHVNNNKKLNYVDFPGFPDNLKWSTQSQNMLDAHTTGVKKAVYGEDNGVSKLTVPKVQRICQLIKDGYTNQQIASLVNEDGATPSNIENIRKKRTWKHVSYKYF